MILHEQPATFKGRDDCAVVHGHRRVFGTKKSQHLLAQTRDHEGCALGAHLFDRLLTFLHGERGGLLA